VEIVEMDDGEFYVPDDVLEEASAARYQMLHSKSKLRYQKEFEKITTSERKTMSESELKSYPLVTVDTDSLSRNVTIPFFS
jgi:hypothetical protein